MFVLNHERQLPAPMDRAVGNNVQAANDFVGAMCETTEVAECNMVKAQQSPISCEPPPRCLNSGWQGGDVECTWGAQTDT